MADKPPSAFFRRGPGSEVGSSPAVEARGTLDYADFSKFYDHYLPRVLAFSRSGAANTANAERLTEAILAEALLSGQPLTPGRAADAALLDAARRVGVRDETETSSRSSRENG